MYACAYENKERNRGAVGHSTVQKKTEGKQGFGFVNNRPESVAQRKLQELPSSGDKESSEPIQYKVVQLLSSFVDAIETKHYRDDGHGVAKAQLLAADVGNTISSKIYNKHKAKKHSGKCVSLFPTTVKGQTMVVVTYADLENGVLKYDTAYFSSSPSSPESSAISYHPTSPVISYKA